MLLLRVCILCLLWWSTTGHADPSSPLQAIAAERGWIKLGRYELASRQASGWLSAIHSESFFLSPDGRSDPLAELRATLLAFSAPPGANPDQHAQCRFPARWMWLKARLGDHPDFRAPVTCPGFEAWTRKGSVKSVSIVLATGYLGNPASFYGHTLLKFNSPSDRGHTRLLDVSVNYGAIVEKNDDPVTYIVKSLFGGYDGGFSHIAYYAHSHNYAENELRDLWEFQLDLPQRAVDLIVAHAWEVLGKRYVYEFFHNNCAYRMAEIVEIADGVDITPKRWPWIIPQAMIEEIGAVRYHGRPLLAGVVHTPSRQSRFYEKYLSLSSESIAVLRDLVDGTLSIDDADFRSLPIPTKQALLDALLDYYQVVGGVIEKAAPEIKLAYGKALAARYGLPPGSPEVNTRRSTSPHLARSPGWFQVAAGHHSITGDVLSLRVRPAYYDALDGDSGHVRNALLSMGDLRLNARRGRVYVEKAEIIGVDSVNPGVTRLPGDNGSAWKVHVGAEQARLRCDNCLVARLQGDMGWGRQWSDGIFAAAYVGGALQNNRANQGAGFVRASLDVVVRPRDDFGLKLGLERRYPVGSREKAYGVGRFEGRLALGPRADLRINYVHDAARMAGVGIGMYW